MLNDFQNSLTVEIQQQLCNEVIDEDAKVSPDHPVKYLKYLSLTVAWFFLHHPVHRLSLLPSRHGKMGTSQGAVGDALRLGR